VDLTTYLQIAVLALCVWLVLLARRSVRLGQRITALLDARHSGGEPVHPPAASKSRGTAGLVDRPMDAASDAVTSEGALAKAPQLALVMDGRIVMSVPDLGDVDLAGRERFDGIYLEPEEIPLVVERLDDRGAEIASHVGSRIRDRRGK
jgi:hypothetical protein